MFFSQNLKYLREENKMSQRELAQALGLSSDVVDMFEKGCRMPDIETTVCIASYFDRDLEELVLKNLRPTRSRYADNLAYLRKSGEMSLEEMGNLLRVNGSTILKYESRECPVDVEKLMELSGYLGITLEQLVYGDLSKGWKAITDNQKNHDKSGL